MIYSYLNFIYANQLILIIMRTKLLILLIVEGGKLTMKMDENQNNQYEPDEITVFTKAK
jgi:hypothetical protein